MKRILLTFVSIAGLFLMGLLSWAKFNGESSLQLELRPGQALMLDLSAGDYRIEAGAKDQIVVISQEQDPKSRSRARFGVNTSAEQAAVKVEGPQNYAALIQVPKHSNLKIRLNGGRLRVNGVEGDKDIESNAGMISIDLGQPQNYARVEASVDIGHIASPPFQVEEEGFARFFARDGVGEYHLRAHVGTGEIRLVAGEI
jgi:hypothetical protein